MRAGSWSEAELAVLREQYGRLSYEAIGQLIGRTESAVKGTAKRMGICVSRQWKEFDLQFVRDNTPAMTAPQIAKALGVRTHQVYSARNRLGLTTSHASFGAEFDSFLRSKHAEGWSDAEIAQAWKCDRHAVGFRRRRLGLAENTLSARRIARVRQKTAAQLAAAGMTSMAELRIKAYRDRARALGWPEDLSMRAVQILETLYQNGPMTRRQIGEKLGLPENYQWLDNQTGTSYLGSLMRRGLVVSLGRVVQNGGQSKNTYLYSTPLFLAVTYLAHQNASRATKRLSGQMDLEQRLCGPLLRRRPSTGCGRADLVRRNWPRTDALLVSQVSHCPLFGAGKDSTCRMKMDAEKTAQDQQPQWPAS
jgi:hypothetical protein